MTGLFFGLFRLLADNRNPTSLANRLRRRRFEVFLTLFDEVVRNTDRRPIQLLDVGGTRDFWVQMGFGDRQDVAITLLNTEPAQFVAPAAGVEYSTSFLEVIGDGCSMPQFEDGAFDLVFSNSVIEHVGGLDRQQQFLDEQLRVGRYFFLQTPNFYFPIEPHFHVPGFQFLPRAARAALVQRFPLGWSARTANRAAALAIVDSVRLLTATQLRSLCSRGVIRRERFVGMTKSLMLLGSSR